MSLNPITDVKGIGQSTADILSEHGVHTVEELARIDIDLLIAIPGFSGTRAARVIKEAQAVLAATAGETKTPVPETAAEVEEKPAKVKTKKKKKKDKPKKSKAKPSVETKPGKAKHKKGKEKKQGKKKR